jgi:hypothetical protein
VHEYEENACLHHLDNAVTVMRDDTGQRINERGTVIEFMGGQQVYIVVTVSD